MAKNFFVKGKMNMKKQIIRSIIIVAGMIFLGHYTQAASFIVNSTQDTNDTTRCTYSKACTLRAAIIESQTVPGPDTITITAKGTLILNGDLPLITEPGLTIIGPGSEHFEISSNYQVFQIGNTHHVFISGIKITTGLSIGTVFVLRSNNCTFSDIKIVGCGSPCSQILMDFSRSDFNTITNCYATQGRIGFLFRDGSDHNTISGSTSIANRHSGITMYDSDYNTVVNNTIKDISLDFGMFLIFGADHNLVENNTFTGNTIAAIVTGNFSTIDGGSNADNIICYNTINDNGAGIVSSDPGVLNLVIEGNTIAHNRGDGIRLSNSGILPEGTEIRNNILLENGPPPPGTGNPDKK